MAPPATVELHRQPVLGSVVRGNVLGTQVARENENETSAGRWNREAYQGPEWRVGEVYVRDCEPIDELRAAGL